MRLKTLFLTGVFIFVTGGLFLHFHPYFQQPVSALSVPLLTVAAGQIQTISIQNEREELLLTQQGNQWLATNGQWSNPVAEQRISALLMAIDGIYAREIVAQSPDSWEAQWMNTMPEMHLVHLYDQQGLAESFYLGSAMAGDSSNVFLRMPGSAVIYRVASRLADTWLQPFDTYRQAVVLSLAPAAVQGMAMRYQTQTQSYWRSDSLQRVWLEDWLEQLASLRVEIAADFGGNQDMPFEALASVELYAAFGDTLQLDFYRDANRLDLPVVIRSSRQQERRYFRCDSLQLKDLMIQ